MGIKGCARQMVVLNGGSGSVFETAYFIVKANAEDVNRGDMMQEANRIIRENCFSARRSKKERLWSFVLGACIGAAAVGLAWLLWTVLI